MPPSQIPFRVRWQDLKDLFRKSGRVVRADVTLGPDNRSRGHGTVVYSTEEEAKNAISKSGNRNQLVSRGQNMSQEPKVLLLIRCF